MRQLGLYQFGQLAAGRRGKISAAEEDVEFRFRPDQLVSRPPSERFRRRFARPSVRSAHFFRVPPASIRAPTQRRTLRYLTAGGDLRALINFFYIWLLARYTLPIVQGFEIGIKW